MKAINNNFNIKKNVCMQALISSEIYLFKSTYIIDLSGF